MKTLQSYFYESFVDSFKEKITKMIDNVMKHINKPGILISNGNCYAPGHSINYDIPAINDLIDKCITYLKKNYGNYITNEKKFDTKNYNVEGKFFNFSKLNETEISKIYTELGSFFMDTVKETFNNKKTNYFSDGTYSLIKYNHDTTNYSDKYTAAFVLYDSNNKFLDYVYPFISLSSED